MEQRQRARSPDGVLSMALSSVTAVLAFLFFFRLGDVPGLHGDEAWFGLRAHEMLGGTNLSWHGPYAHTGGLYPLLVSLVFRSAGVSVTTLRVLGAVLGLATLVTVAAVAARVGDGARSALRVLLLAAGSLLVTGEWRVAWEATALGPFLAALVLMATAGFLLARAPPARAAWCALLLAASAAGVVNHLIFLVLLLALAGTSLAVAARDARGGAPILVLSSFTLATSAALVLVKLVSFHLAKDPPAWRWLLLILVAGESALANVLLRPRVVAWVEQVVRERHRAVRNTLRFFFGVGGIVFVFAHGLAFVETLSNEVLMQRLFSRSLPILVCIASLAFTLALLGLYGRALVRLQRGAVTPDPIAAFFLILPAATMAAMPLFILDNSIRYYILPQITLILAMAIADPAIGAPVARWMTPLMAAHAAVVLVAVVPVLLEQHPYDAVAPRRFHFGYRLETSAHFVSTAEVHARLAADGATALETDDPWFLRLPLRFYDIAEGRTPLTDGGRGAAGLHYAYDRPGGLVYTPPSLP